jgi:hypothetical protein
MVELQIPLAPQLILCGPQEAKRKRANNIKRSFFIFIDV